MRLMHLGFFSLLGCITSSALGWLGSLTPGLFGVAAFVYILSAVLWSLAWCLDEPIYTYLGLPEPTYHAYLIAIAAIAIIGGLTRLTLGVLL
jgi:hypothetical protein